MKILKSIFIVILFSSFIISCTVEDIAEESESNAIENIQATGEDDDELDPAEKD